MSALLRKCLYFIVLLAATVFILNYIPAFAQQTPKLSDWYPPTAIPTANRTPTRAKMPSATPTQTSTTPMLTYPPGAFSPTPLPSGYPTLTPSPSKKPKKSPTPTETSEDGNTSVQQVKKLVTDINKACKADGVVGKVSSSNYTCLNEIDPPLSSKVLADLTYNSTHGSWMQCTDFVRGSVALLTGKTMTDCGHAMGYHNCNVEGYKYIEKNSGQKIQINDIPVWVDDAVGHIAYVIDVGSNNFLVAEANWNCSGCARMQYWRSLDDPELVGWQRKI